MGQIDLSFITDSWCVQHMSTHMRSRAILSTVVLILVLLPLTAVDVGAQGTNEPPTLFHFYQTDGDHFDEVLTVNGTSSVPLQNVTWQVVNISLFDQSEVIVSGDFLSSVIPSGEERWSWMLSIDVSGVDCTCAVEVFFDGLHEEEPATIIVYLGQEMATHRPVLSPPEQDLYLLTTGMLHLQLDAVTPDGSLNGSMIYATVCEAPSSVCLVESVPFKLVATYNDYVQITMDATDLLLPDGFWRFTVEMEDRTLKPSNPVNFTIHLDRQAPIVLLSHTLSSNTQVENAAQNNDADVPTTPEHTEIFFIAEVSDGYAGASEVLTWSKTSPSGSQSAFADASFISDSSVSLVPDEAGEWTIILLVRDSAGHLVRSTSSIMVENQAPTVVLTLDGLRVNDGDSVMLPAGDSWLMSANQSVDTENDKPGLTYTWYLDDAMIHTGVSLLGEEVVRLMEQGTINSEGTQSMRIVVTDDDGASNEVTFFISSQVDSMKGSQGLLGANTFTLALVIVLVLSSLLVIRMGTTPPKESLPKWQRKKE